VHHPPLDPYDNRLVAGVAYNDSLQDAF